MQDLINRYAEVFDHLLLHDATYASPEFPKSLIRIENADFEGKMVKVTAGSELIMGKLPNDKLGQVSEPWCGLSSVYRIVG